MSASMSKALKWVLVNGTFAALLLSAVVWQVEGAKNIVLFIIWLMVPLSAVMLTETAQKAMANKVPPANPVVDRAYDCAVLSLLLWHGWIVSAVAYLAHAFLSSAAWDMASKRKSELSP